MTKPNATIARLDRRAAQIGVALTESGNSRSFRMGDRLVTYKPGGKGIVQITVERNGAIDAIAYGQSERVEALFRRAKELA